MDDALIAVRAVHVAASVAAAGAVLFRLWVAAPALGAAGATMSSKRLDRRIDAIAWASLAVFVVSAVAWLLLVAAEASGQPLGEVFGSGAAATLLARTRFGHVFIVRVAVALALGLYLLRARPDPAPLSRGGCVAAALAAFLLGALALMGHGGATPGTPGIVHLVADAAHAIAAGVWVGGLLPLALLLAAARRAGDAPALAAARAATRRFSNLGLASVATLLATGIVNTIFLVGSVPALVGTRYGQLLSLKILVFLAMVAIAALNRLRLTPQLSVHDPEKWEPVSRLREARGRFVRLALRFGGRRQVGKDHARRIAQRAVPAMRRLERNALIEAGLGLAILAIVGALGTMPPALHMAHDHMH